MVQLPELPAQLTSFVGRDRDLAEVRRLLTDARLVTLVGAGGAGKTRLALQLAAQLAAEGPGRVWFADLSAAWDAASVEEAMLVAVGAMPEPGRRAAQVLADRTGEGLLVVDNCEQVVEPVARIVDATLRLAGRLRILATSREPLAIIGEGVYRVPSLRVPPADDVEPEELLRYPAARLFADRARLARPDFLVDADNADKVAAICRRLDGIPLALELAAARLRTLSIEDIADRLRDRFKLLAGASRTAPKRQQTLEAALDWSYQLLVPDERVVFDRVSALSPPFTLASAEAVATGDPVERDAVLDLLSQLVDRSLVEMAETPRRTVYRLAETMREFGLRRLQERGEAAAVLRRSADDAERRQDHRAALAALRACLDVLPADDPARIDVLDQLAWETECLGDYATGVAALREIQSALEAAGEAGERLATTHLRLSSFLPMATGDFAAGEEAARRAVELFTAAGRADRALAAANELGWLKGLAGDLAGQVEQARQVLSEAEAAGDETVVLHALGSLSVTITMIGDAAAGIGYAERGVAIARARGDLYQSTWFAMSLALCLALAGHLERALAVISEARAAEFSVREVLDGSVMSALLAGDYRVAVSEAAEARRTRPPMLEPRGSYLFSMAAAAHAELGELDEAARYAEWAESVYSRGEFFFQSRVHAWAMADVAWCRGDTLGALARLRQTSSSLAGIGERLLRCLVLYDLAEVAEEAGSDREAATARDEIRTDGPTSPLPQALGMEPGREQADALAKLGYRALAARSLHLAGRRLVESDSHRAASLLEPAVALFADLGCSWRQARAQADLARTGAVPASSAGLALARSPVFAGLPAPDLEALAARSTVATSAAAQRISVPNQAIGIVARGVVEEVRGDITLRHRAGDLFDEQGLFEATHKPLLVKAAEEVEMVLIDHDDLLRFLEMHPVVADRLLTVIRSRPGAAGADLPAKVTAAIQRLSAAEGRAAARLEVLPVYLADGDLRRLEPVDAETWLVAASREGDPAAEVVSALASAGLSAVAVHSTSWRTAKDGIVLTYLAVLAGPPGSSPGLRDRAVERRDLARGGATSAPGEILVDQVVEHALRHLSWLSRDDPAIAEVLAGKWPEILAGYRPEPFRAL
jgi:predicted ATPase/CRP-like cAMP-binding protein